MDDFDELLAGADAGEDFGAHGLRFDLVAEFLGDLVVDVGGEESEAHLTDGIGDVGFAELAVAAQRLKDALKLFLEEIETHGGVSLKGSWAGVESLTAGE